MALRMQEDRYTETINVRHAFAAAILDYPRHAHVFELLLPNGGLIYFEVRLTGQALACACSWADLAMSTRARASATRGWQCDSHESLMLWVRGINWVASVTSQAPLPAAVGSSTTGFLYPTVPSGLAQLPRVRRARVSRLGLGGQGSVGSFAHRRSIRASTRGHVHARAPGAQIQQLELHLKRLGEVASKIFAHAELRPKLDDGAGGPHATPAVEAWDQEMTYLNHERRKYHVYVSAIQDPPPHRPDGRHQAVVSSGVALSPLSEVGLASTSSTVVAAAGASLDHAPS